MKRLVWAAMLLSLAGLNTGCCLLDRICGVHPGYPLVPGCGARCGNGCGPSCGPACNSCGPGGCSSCGAAGHDEFYSTAPVPGNANCHACGCGLHAGPTTDGAYYADGTVGHGHGGVMQAGYGHVPHYARHPRSAARYGGPVTPQVVYPYYTTRGPRDFLSPNPRGIGP